MNVREMMRALIECNPDDEVRIANGNDRTAPEMEDAFDGTNATTSCTSLDDGVVCIYEAAPAPDYDEDDDG